MKPNDRERYRRLSGLLDRMLDGEDPKAVLREVDDAELRAELQAVWEARSAAEERGFLVAPGGRADTEEQGVRFAAGARLANRFEVVALIGTGGMGEVYRARDLLLGKEVALKTVRLGLALEGGMRERFLQEVQNSQQVTSEYVCRIFDHFEWEGQPFYSMELLQGPDLRGWLEETRPGRRARLTVAAQIAKGLASAHRTGIIHRDLKPSNVLVTGEGAATRAKITDFGLARAYSALAAEGGETQSAGTPHYMAPELWRGAPARPLSDIYSFGRLLEDLLPRHPVVKRCCEEDPGRRWRSMDEVIAQLEGGSTRRTLALGLLGAAGLAGAYGWWGQRGIRTPFQQRLAVNGFGGPGAGGARVFRELLMRSLGESALFRVLPDDRLRAVLRKAGLPGELPVERGRFQSAAALSNVPFVLQGLFQTAGAAGGALEVTLEAAGSGEVLSQWKESWPGAVNPIPLAERIALRIRESLGESEEARRANYRPLGVITTASPEALECYLQGMLSYEKADSAAAETWLRKALELDPEFALAHLNLGLALSTQLKLDSALVSYRRAHELSGRASRREQLWIECRWRSSTGDHEGSLGAARQLARLYPDEPVFARHLAFCLARTGRAEQALEPSRRAVELDPYSENNVSEWMVNAALAGRPGEALEIFAGARERGQSGALLHWGAGLACLCRDEPAEAMRHFEAMGASAGLERDALQYRAGVMILQGQFLEAETRIGTKARFDEVVGEEEYVAQNRSWRAWLGYWLEDGATLQRELDLLGQLPATPAWMQWHREAGVVAAKAGHFPALERAVRALREIERQWPSTHSSGVRAHLEGLLLLAAGDGQAGRALREAEGLWGDPLTLRSVSQWHEKQQDWASQRKALEGVLEQRGLLLKYQCPGYLVESWLELARCHARMSSAAAASRFYQQVLAHWAGIERLSSRCGRTISECRRGVGTVA